MAEFIRVYGLEIAGTLASIVYLYYSIREKVWCWPWGIFASAISIAVFFSARLYADMGLQFYYLFISLYGWYYWLYGKSRQGGDHVEITRAKGLQWLYLFFAGVVLYIMILGVLLFVPDWLQIEKSSMPYLDALTTAASIVATWMLARKIIQHWLIWIVVDVMSMGMYLYKGMYFYAFLFVVFSAGALLGYVEWRKKISIK